MLGLQSRPLLTVDQMRRASAQDGEEECPGKALHETGHEAVVAYNDVS